MKKFETEMLNLTYECLTRYWQKDYKFVISYCAKEVIWCEIGRASCRERV